MPTDYRDASARHWEDAGHLSADNRLANADHLFGLAAECALKAVMQGLGMKMNPKNPDKPENPYGIHIDKLWDEFVSFANDRSAAMYTSGMDAVSNPFFDWDVGQRYYHRAAVTLEAVERHKAGAETTKAALDAALENGVVL